MAAQAGRMQAKRCSSRSGTLLPQSAAVTGAYACVGAGRGPGAAGAAVQGGGGWWRGSARRRGPIRLAPTCSTRLMSPLQDGQSTPACAYEGSWAPGYHALPPILVV
jgi:hypothetical protein